MYLPHATSCAIVPQPRRPIMAKSHSEYVAEIIGDHSEFHCCAPGCENVFSIAGAEHVDLRQVKNLKAWHFLSIEDLVEKKAIFCEEHKRLLQKAAPGIKFMVLDHTIQKLAEHRQIQAAREEERMAEEKRRQEQMAAERAKVEALASFAAELFDTEAGPRTNQAAAKGSCRLQVINGLQSQQIRQKFAG